MNKKDVATIRKQFKLDNDLMNITDIFNVYVTKESSEIFHQESQPFQMLEREQQELFLNNFKKVLTGQLDSKLFELKFRQETVEGHGQQILLKGLQADNVDAWKEEMLQLVTKMLTDKQYTHDVVITFIRGSYYKPTKSRNEEAEISEFDEVYHHTFILCSINKTEVPKKSLLFDYVEREFKYNVVVDSVINLNAPITGFLYPSFTDNAADVNHILYSTGKANEPDPHFVEDVLNGEAFMTAQEDKIVFEEIVKDVVGEEVNTATLSNVYDEINRVIDETEDDESPTLDAKDMERVLKVSGIEDVTTQKVGMAFKKVIDNEHFELKASNVIPKYNSKSIKIKTKVANISISPQELKYVKQVTLNGKRCLVLEIDEDVEIEGFRMIPEAFQ